MLTLDNKKGKQRSFIKEHSHTTQKHEERKKNTMVRASCDQTSQEDVLQCDRSQS